VHTSGTSGEVGYFLYAPADHARLARAAMRNREAYRSLFPREHLRPRRIRVAFLRRDRRSLRRRHHIASLQQV